MKQKIEFYESQSMRQWWIWAIMIGINLYLLFGVIWQVILGNQFGNNPMSDAGLITVTAIFMAISVMLFLSKLNTTINNEGIYINYLPFNLNTVFIAWDNIQAAELRIYNAFYEFGGWGVRSWTSKKKCYTVSGKFGLQLELKNGKKVLIGTQMPDEIETLLKKVSEFKPRF